MWLDQAPYIIDHDLGNVLRLKTTHVLSVLNQGRGDRGIRYKIFLHNLANPLRTL